MTARLTFAVDNWLVLQPIILPLWQRHNEEVAAPEDRDQLDPDWDKFDEMSARGIDHWVTARLDGQLVGYGFAIIETHLHRRKTLSAFWDLYYLVPEQRLGNNGRDLLRFMRASLWQRGVRKQYAGTKLWKDMGVLFERDGWQEAERLYTISLGG